MYFTRYSDTAAELSAAAEDSTDAVENVIGDRRAQASIDLVPVLHLECL